MMGYPGGLVICCNTVLISQINHILVYQLDGKFVSRIGNRGSGNLQFNYFFGLATDEFTNDVYICVSTTAYKLSLKTSNTSLNSVKKYFTDLVISNSTKAISLSLINRIHVSTFSTKI